MNKICVSLLLFLGAVLSGCASTASTSTNPADYVGEYIFTPYGASPGEFADFVILKKDGSAVEIRFSKDTGQISTTQEKWYLYHATGEYVAIAKRGYPIERSGATIKLNINDDLDEYYEKVR